MKKNEIVLNVLLVIGMTAASACVPESAVLAQGVLPDDSKLSTTIHTTIGGHDSRSLDEQQADAYRWRQGNLFLADGEKRMAEGKPLEAINMYLKSIAAVPSPMANNGDAYVRLGDAYRSVNRYADAAAAYDKLWIRQHPQDSPVFWLSGTFRAATLVKYAMLLKQSERFADALKVYHMAMEEYEIKEGYDGVKFADAHLNVNADNVNSSEFDLACDLAMGAALASSDRNQALPYLLEVTRRRPHLAVAHYFLATALRWSLPSPERTEAESRTSWRAEFQKAAQMGSGSVKESAERMLK